MVRVCAGIGVMLPAIAFGAEVPAPPVFMAELSSITPFAVPAEIGERAEEKLPEGGGALPDLRRVRLDFAGVEALHEAARRGQSGLARLNLFEGAAFEWKAERTALTAAGYTLSGPLADGARRATVARLAMDAARRPVTTGREQRSRRTSYRSVPNSSSRSHTRFE